MTARSYDIYADNPTYVSNLQTAMSNLEGSLSISLSNKLPYRGVYGDSPSAGNATAKSLVPDFGTSIQTTLDVVGTLRYGAALVDQGVPAATGITYNQTYYDAVQTALNVIFARPTSLNSYITSLAQGQLMKGSVQFSQDMRVIYFDDNPPSINVLNWQYKSDNLFDIQFQVVVAGEDSINYEIYILFNYLGTWSIVYGPQPPSPTGYVINLDCGHSSCNGMYYILKYKGSSARPHVVDVRYSATGT
jgi:hypothetical protein